MMITHLPIEQKEVAQEVLAVQLPAYRIEAAIIESDAIPALRDTVDSLMDCGETFYGIREGETLIGAISFKIEEDTLDIHRLVIHPDHFRKGIGRKLVQYVLEHHPEIRKFIVATGSKNTPALALYASEGFIAVREFEVMPGLLITELEKH